MAVDPVLDCLASLATPSEVMPCDPSLADTAQFCEAYGISLDDSANAILVVGKGEPRTYAVCVVLATTRLDVNGAVRRRLAVKKASFASAEETVEITGMMIGGVTPFGLPADLAIWVDTRVMERPSIILGGGSRDRKVRAAPTILTDLGAEVVPDLAKPAEA